MQSKIAINKIINETPDFEKMVNRIEVETLGNFLMNYSSDLSYIKAFQNWKTNGFKDFSYFEQEEYSLKNFLIEYKLLRFIRKEKHYELFLKISEYFIQQKEIDVVKFAKCLSERNEISMASKILFLHSPKKIIIYDKYAKIGIDFNGNSYEQFVSKVKSNSLKCNEIIIKLSKQIPKSVCVIEKEILNIDCSEIRQNRLIDKLFWTFGKVIDNQKKNMKKSLLLIALFFSLTINAQEDKIVTLTVSGTGKTIEEAKNNALRSAIEQAFGAFISSKTEILNDNLVKDEIVSVANGNIQKVEVISEVEVPNTGYATSLKATVSVTKLTSFVESKGVEVEFKGSLFAFNVNQQILNEKNEIKAIEDLCKIITNLSDVSFDYTMKASEPIAVNASNEKWRIPMYISVSANDNILSVANYMNQTLKALSLSIDEASNYMNLGKKIYPISFAANEKESNYILLRTEKGFSNLISQLYYFNHSIQNFKISNGLSEWQIIDAPKNLKYIYDYGFRIFIKKGNNGSDYNAYCKSSVFYTHCDNQFNCNVGTVLELNEVNGGNCGFNPILNYLNWNNISYMKLNGFQTELKINSSNVGSWNTADAYFVKQFAFVKKLKNVINSQTGLIISFIGIKPQNEIVRFYYEDEKSLDEINKISAYKVSSIRN